MITFIYGPQGCGKTTKAKQFAEFYGATQIVEEPSLVDLDNLPENSLVLVQDWFVDEHYNEIIRVAHRVIPYEIAALELEKGKKQ